MGEKTIVFVEEEYLIIAYYIGLIIGLVVGWCIARKYYKNKKEVIKMTHTVKESLRWLGVVMIYGKERKNTYGASFFLPKDSDKVGAYKVRQNWRVFWKPKALKVRTVIEEYYWTKALMDRCD